MNKQFTQLLAHVLVGAMSGIDIREPNRRRIKPPKKCIMCGRPKVKDSQFCDGKIPFMGKRTCKEVFRSDPKHWDKECYYGEKNKNRMLRK